MAKEYLEANSIKVHFGMKTVLDIDSFALHEGDRMGLVGENGAGKTTFLRVLAGEIAPDEGTVNRARPLAYVRQLGDEENDSFDARLGAVFQVEEKREGLSGGEKTRRRVAAALSSGAHILLADEPTTDLDAKGVALLRDQLLSFDGALLLVSHDRSLLDAVCTSIAELRDGNIELFPGNYAAYKAERERRMDYKRFEYDQYRSEQARLRGSIQGKVEQGSQIRKTPKRMGLSEARLHRRGANEVVEKIAKERKALESRLAHLEEKERVRDDPAIRMRLGAASPVVSKTAIEARAFTMRVGGKTLLENASMRVPTGSVTALLGDNGCGKTSLIRRILAGNDPRLRVSPGVKIGFFGQDHAESLHMEKTALQNAMDLSACTQAEARTVLARLGILETEAFQQAETLSGGERAKVALARLMLADVNLLILDEPTNHLDVYAMEALEPLLAAYEGTVLLVSHDEHFVEAVADRLVFYENRTLVSFEGGMAQWKAAQSRDDSEEQARLERGVLEMRMALLAARLSTPKKGDDPLELNEQYLALAEQIRTLDAKRLASGAYKDDRHRTAGLGKEYKPCAANSKKSGRRADK